MNIQHQIRVLLVEDHALVRVGTKALLEADPEIKVVGEAETAEDALRLAEELGPDVILLDIRLKSGNGIDVARALLRKGSPARVLVLTAHDFEQYVDALARAGVRGYILKDTPPDQLIKAVHEVHEGHGVLPGRIAASVLDSLTRERRDAQRTPDDLTIREIEVLELLCQGRRNQEIAERLGISQRTAESHVANILSKLGATTRADGVRLAIEHGYIKKQ